MQKERVALVTGGTRGIGRAICEGLTNAGYKVAATYGHRDDVAARFTEETGVPAYKYDVADPDQCRAVVQMVSHQMGSIAVLVNNAGITRDTTMHTMTPEQWSDVIDTNLSGCFHMSRAVIKDMREHGFGRIVNISSINGQNGQYGQVNYAAAKAGVLGLTRALALENAGKGITVNAIAPGYVDTDMVRDVPPAILEKIVAKIPVGRLGRAEDIARGVLFLVADGADFITGATLDINGGQLMS